MHKNRKQYWSTFLNLNRLSFLWLWCDFNRSSNSWSAFWLLIISLVEMQEYSCQNFLTRKWSASQMIKFFRQRSQINNGNFLCQWFEWNYFQVCFSLRTIANYSKWLEQTSQIIRTIKRHSLKAGLMSKSKSIGNETTSVLNHFWSKWEEVWCWVSAWSDN